MAVKFPNGINLVGQQALGVRLENLGSDPTPGGEGHIYWHSGSDVAFVYNGSAWRKLLMHQVQSGEYAAGSIVNADINASAAIALSKLATDPLARANHTGTQLAATISNFDTAVRTSRLDQMAAPTSNV